MSYSPHENIPLFGEGFYVLGLSIFFIIATLIKDFIPCLSGFYWYGHLSLALIILVFPVPGFSCGLKR